MPLPPAWLLVSAAGVSTLLHLRAEYRGPRWQVYLFKPLTITILLLLALLPPPAASPAYRIAIASGLACSLVGDVFLMLPHDRFLPGLMSFFVAHLAYTFGFAMGVPAGAGIGVLLLLAVVGLPLVAVLWPSLGRLKVPVLLYIAVILGMAWRAWARNLVFPTTGTALAAVGATLFLLSDAILAVKRFRRPFQSAQALIMLSYEAAQCLIALSVSGS